MVEAGQGGEKLKNDLFIFSFKNVKFGNCESLNLL